MSGVFQNIDPPPPLRSASVYPPPLVRGEDTLAGWRGGRGPIVWKTPDTALYSVYVSTLWARLFLIPGFSFVLSRYASTVPAFIYAFYADTVVYYI
jgi:hypothetical protein